MARLGIKPGCRPFKINTLKCIEYFYDSFKIPRNRIGKHFLIFCDFCVNHMGLRVQCAKCYEGFTWWWQHNLLVKDDVLHSRHIALHEKSSVSIQQPFEVAGGWKCLLQDRKVVPRLHQRAQQVVHVSSGVSYLVPGDFAFLWIQVESGEAALDLWTKCGYQGSPLSL